MEIKEGDIVNYHSIIGRGVTSTGHEVKYIMEMPNNFGCAMAKISGKSGLVAVEALSK